VQHERDGQGGPVVIRNEPFLVDGTPMPNRYWLVGADLRDAVSRLEAGGGVRRAESEVDATALAAAHDRYAAERDAAIPAGWPGPRPRGGVGGARAGVKCLHAHLAWFLAGGDDPVGAWVAARLPGAPPPFLAPKGVKSTTFRAQEAVKPPQGPVVLP